LEPRAARAIAAAVGRARKRDRVEPCPAPRRVRCGPDRSYRRHQPRPVAHWLVVDKREGRVHAALEGREARDTAMDRLRVSPQRCRADISHGVGDRREGTVRRGGAAREPPGRGGHDERAEVWPVARLVGADDERHGPARRGICRAYS
jgi:hypothetical protein